MSYRKYKLPALLLIILILKFCSISPAGKSRSEPILYFACADSNSTEKFVTDINNCNGQQVNLVIATHGWYEKEPWAEELALAIKDKVDSEKWLCGWYDWRDQADVINPTNATKYARDTAGPMLGERIVKLPGNFKHIHLIGHSAGSWVISEAAKIISSKTDADIHLTFLDAYVPPFWEENELGNLNRDPNKIYWADHYYTHDFTLKTTEIILTNAHNVNLTKVNPGVNNHKFPHYWYHATVIGKYAKRRYKNKELYCSSGDIEYGFARGLEAGAEDWEKRTELKMANAPVELKRPKKAFKLKLEELFKKH